jgi:hypothetical protein
LKNAGAADIPECPVLFEDNRALDLFAGKVGEVLGHALNETERR